MQIHDLTRQNPATGSQLVFDTGSATYKALVSDVAKVIMEQYNGTTLAGSAQTPKAAIDTLNGNLTTLQMRYLNAASDDLDALYNTSDTGFYLTGSGTAHSPYNYAGLIVIARNGTAFQIVFPSGSSNQVMLRARSGNPLTWTAWRAIA